jgi:hypothetical protein
MFQQYLFLLFKMNHKIVWLFFQTFQIKRLTQAVKEGTLDNLITELLLWLLDERAPLMDDGSQLLKALNVLMLKILVCKILSHVFICHLPVVSLMVWLLIE